MAYLPWLHLAVASKGESSSSDGPKEDIPSTIAISVENCCAVVASEGLGAAQILLEMSTSATSLACVVFGSDKYFYPPDSGFGYQPLLKFVV
jgi:hypothetical protein